MFSKEDFKVDSVGEFVPFLLIVPFVALIAPFLLASYTLGFFEDMVGWLET
ncbi:MAG: hypothetical protein KA436_05010 [Oligoflexales bacterium]|nr:hypothetical protein [Oligoflexales bacterium]